MQRLERRRRDPCDNPRPMASASATPLRHAGLALACLLLAGCAIPKEIDPLVIYREVTGLSDEGRRPPPGLEDPFPNLASVPPRPERPSVAARDAISAALAADRTRSRDPLVLRGVPGGPGAATSAAGPGQMPAGPPSRPIFAAVPRVPWTDPPAGGDRGNAADARRGQGDAAARPAPQPPEMPDTAPAPPPPDLLGAPPPPPIDLLAPRPR